MSQMVPFQFDSHSLRVQLDDVGQPWFNANDVCAAMELANPRDALAKHVDSDDVAKRDIIDSLGRVQLASFVNESGLYALIMGSTKPEAKRFKRWITSEVLPSIRKTGSYTSKPEQPKALDYVAPAKQFAAIHRVMRMIGIDKNAAAISANQAVAASTGVDFMKIANITHLEAERQDTQWFTPTEIGKRIGCSGRGVNLLLAGAGMQMKRGETWEVLEAGRDFARILDTGKKHGNGTPVQQIKWSPQVIPLLEAGSFSLI